MDMAVRKPVIGILSQRVKENNAVVKKFPDIVGRPFINVSYKKYMVSSGGETYLIDCSVTEEKARKIYDAIDGLLLPGGSADMHSDYVRIAKLFYKWSQEDFDSNTRTFPILGICLGFQFLLRRNKNKEVSCLTKTKRIYGNLPVKFYRTDSRLYQCLPNDYVNQLENESITFNSHVYSLRLEDVSKHTRIVEDIKIVATSVSHESNMEFVAAIEGVKYPLFGLQWHPEKNEHEDHINICHTDNSAKCSDAIGRFFIQFCKNHIHRTSDEKLDTAMLQIFDTNDASSIKEIFVF